MIEGFDVRTLTVVLLMLAIIHGIGLFCYAKTQSSFRGFWHISAGFLFLAFGFGFISFRGVVSDWLAIVISGFLVVYSINLVGTGILRFFDRPSKNFERLGYVLLVLQVTSFSYFTAYMFDAQWRVSIICSILASQCLYIALQLWRINKGLNLLSVRIFYCSLFVYGLVFVSRAIWSMLYYDVSTKTVITITHISSLLTFLLFLVTTSLIIIWAASDRLQKSLQRQASIDPLTQTYNRRALESLAKVEIARSERESRPFSLVIIDIDDFKNINDSLGHQFGDHVLVSVCQLVSKNLRPYDILARYGGEEFVLLLPNTQTEDALKLAEKLRSIIAEHPFRLPETTETKYVTASFGLTQANLLNCSWEQLVSKADEALYEAKNGGRNKVAYRQG